jgi:hypothetical protein
VAACQPIQWQRIDTPPGQHAAAPNPPSKVADTVN